MPYTAQHKLKTRNRIVECARMLFNRHGYEGVTIDMVMSRAKLTRGGFYNHFTSKEDLFAAAVSSFLMGRGARWRAEAGVDASRPAPVMAERMIASYLSNEHLGDIDGQCPLIALPSDVARANAEVQAGYARLLEAMVGLFQGSLKSTSKAARQKALAVAALCVGGMVLARTLPSSALATETREAARVQARRLISV
ncbi:MAG: TetR/AcrR family transcriptional regulator [Hyphomicrobiales bacterium]|nr:TetR/AcrR family transcriptional regulator [Hyphomicrobiales bacterium]